MEQENREIEEITIKDIARMCGCLLYTSAKSVRRNGRKKNDSIGK